MRHCLKFKKRDCREKEQGTGKKRENFNNTRKKECKRMKLKTLVHSFMKRLTKSAHLLPLMGDEYFVISLQDETDSYSLLISKDEQIVVSGLVQQANVRIQGDNKSYYDLLLSLEALQKLSKQQQVVIEGSFADVLKAEMLIKLATKEQKGKVVQLAS